MQRQTQMQRQKQKQKQKQKQRQKQRQMQGDGKGWTVESYDSGKENDPRLVVAGLSSLRLRRRVLLRFMVVALAVSLAGKW